MLPRRLGRVIDLLARLPGVGEKTAARYALYLVTADPALVDELSDELRALQQTVKPCAQCGYLAEVHSPTEAPLCSICRDPHRDASVLCIVARIQDLMAFERSGAMRGRYFVLAKLLSPLEGVGPEDLPLEQLAKRVAKDGVREAIVATPPTVDGEATALLLARELAPAGVRVTRIASGVPHGGDLEFADQITLGRALEGRRAIE